jgi:hypothetical protein
VIQARIEHQRKLEDAREKHKEWWNLDEEKEEWRYKEGKRG